MTWTRLGAHRLAQSQDTWRLYPRQGDGDPSHRRIASPGIGLPRYPVMQHGELMATTQMGRGIVLACQGGGSHTAFAAGVLEELLAHDHRDIRALSGRWPRYVRFWPGQVCS
jgi:hypothetical protein